MSDPVDSLILYALFCLCRDNRHISAATLARAARTTPTRAAAALVSLERAGLVDASRVRLTMLGLARAAAAGAGVGGGGARRAAPTAPKAAHAGSRPAPLAAIGARPLV